MYAVVVTDVLESVSIHNPSHALGKKSSALRRHFLFVFQYVMHMLHSVDTFHDLIVATIWACVLQISSPTWNKFISPLGLLDKLSVSTLALEVIVEVKTLVSMTHFDQFAFWNK